MEFSNENKSIDEKQLLIEIQEHLPDFVLENLTLVKRIDNEIDYLVLEKNINIDYIIILNDNETEITQNKQRISIETEQISKTPALSANTYDRNNQCFYQIDCDEEGTILLNKVNAKQLVNEIRNDNKLPALFKTINILNGENSQILKPYFKGNFNYKSKKIRLGKKWNRMFISGPPYKCIKCSFSRNNFNEIAEHFKQTRHHTKITKPPDPPYRCEECNLTFLVRKKYLDHNRNTHRERKTKCPMCGKRFLSKSRMVWHLAIHSAEKNFQCDKCAAQFNNPVNLKRHMWIHSDKKPYSCKYCNREFTQSGSLKQHEMIHTNEKPFLCTICGLKFRLKVYLKVHMKQHDIKEKEQIKKIKFPFKCSLCDVVCFTTKELKTHKIENHGYAPKTTYECIICGRQLYSKVNLEVHINNHMGVRPYKCVACDKNFASNQLLKLHSTIHIGIRPFGCELCGKTFTQKPHLTEHMIRHSGIKRFECKFCGKKFFANGALTCHLRIHTGETPYECDVCHMKFKHINNMKVHKKKHLRESEKN